MVILFAVLSDLHKTPSHSLLAEVEKSIEIFRAMSVVLFARRCAELTQELLDVTKAYVRDKSAQEAAEQSRSRTELTSSYSLSGSMAASGSGNINGGGMLLPGEGSLPNPVSSNIMASLLDFDAWGPADFHTLDYGVNTSGEGRDRGTESTSLFDRFGLDQGVFGCNSPGFDNEMANYLNEFFFP